MEINDYNKQLIAANPLVCTWLELKRAFAALHDNNEGDVNRLHDVYVNSVPDPSYTVALPGKSFDERRPRVGDNFKHVINPMALSAWVQDVSKRRGFPYSAKQAYNLIYGLEDYGF